jgi:tRNA 2-thiouridine synthesizing protein E
VRRTFKNGELVNTILVAGQHIELDQDGYLLDLADWSEEVAVTLADNEGLSLSAEHQEIIYALRQFYLEFQLSPAMRPLVAYIRQTLGEEKGNSIYLLSLFPGSPAKLASKIAGLPKPDNCL